jgi:hypothetical protein
VLPAIAALQAVAINPEPPEVNVAPVKPSYFGGAEAVPVGDKKNGAVALIAFVLNYIKKAFEFVEGEESDCFVPALGHGVNGTLGFFCPVHYITPARLKIYHKTTVTS